MSDTLSVDQVADILARMADDLDASKDDLIRLDSAIGDGDMGISMSRGFRSVKSGLAGHPQDAGKMLAKAGMDFTNGAGSTIGALLGTAFMRAGKVVQGQAEVGLSDLARMAKGAEDGVRERGKASPGDKTMLDAMVPAREALEQAAQEGASLAAGLQAAVAAAEKGMLATVEMKSVYGRARWLGDRTVGHQDPGATAIYLMLKSAAETVAQMTRA